MLELLRLSFWDIQGNRLRYLVPMILSIIVLLMSEVYAVRMMEPAGLVYFVPLALIIFSMVILYVFIRNRIFLLSLIDRAPDRLSNAIPLSTCITSFLIKLFYAIILMVLSSITPLFAMLCSLPALLMLNFTLLYHVDESESFFDSLFSGFFLLIRAMRQCFVIGCFVTVVFFIPCVIFFYIADKYAISNLSYDVAVAVWLVYYIWLYPLIQMMLTRAYRVAYRVYKHDTGVMLKTLSDLPLA